jgi:hypothetical protein
MLLERIPPINLFYLYLTTFSEFSRNINWYTANNQSTIMSVQHIINANPATIAVALKTPSRPSSAEVEPDNNNSTLDTTTILSFLGSPFIST